MATFIANSSTVGVDLNNASSTALFAVGTLLEGSAGSEWTYVELGTATAAGTMLTINATNTATLCLSTTTGGRVAFAQAAFSSGAFAWVATRGNPLTVLVSATSTGLGATLYATAASGALTTTAGSGTMAGIQLLTASTTAVLTAFQATVTWPRTLLSGQAG